MAKKDKEKSPLALKAKDEFSFSSLRSKVRGLRDALKGRRDELEAQRERRYLNSYDIQAQMHADGTLDPDAIFIASRLIDTNIRREAPEFTNYLTRPSRTLILDTYNSDQTDPAISLAETDFTRKCRYANWQRPWIKAIDCAQAFGFGLVRVDFDEDAPGNFTLEYVNRRNMLFNDDCIDIESQNYIAEEVTMTGYELYRAVEEYDFNEEVVDSMLSNKQSESGMGGFGSEGETNTSLVGVLDKTYEVYKLYYKKSGLVYVGWLTLNNDKTWLCKPCKLWMGKLNVAKLVADRGNEGVVEELASGGEELDEKYHVYETEFPYVVLKYTEDEAEALNEIKGRCELDQSDQEACTALLTANVKGAIRSTYIQAAPASGQIDSNPGVYAPKQTNVRVEDGLVWDKPMQFYYLPSMTDTSLSVYMTLLNKNQSEQSRPSYAVKNREDSRKTATELKLAAKEDAQLASMQLTLFSMAYLDAYTKCFLIYKSRVMGGALKLADSQSGQIMSVLSAPLILRPSGDIDVIERERKLAKQLQFWPIIGNTAAGIEFLKDIIKSAFPDEADKYNAMLDQAQASNEKLQEFAMALLNMVAQDQVLSQAAPQFQQMVQQALQQVTSNGQQPQVTNGQQ